jgi:hypothetical protein
MTCWRQGRCVRLLAVLALAAGCAGGGSDGGGGGGGGPKPCAPPAQASVSFANNIQPIFTASCAVSSACHAGVVPAQNYDLTAGKSLAQSINVKSSQNAKLDRIEPGRPERSYTFIKTGAVPGAQLLGTLMPQGCPGAPLAGAQCLSADQIEAIRTWIEECAQDN